MENVKYPIGIQNFEKMISGGYLYVDKTSYIRDLVDNGSIYFLSRPRRFGKSLVLSTLQAFFEGKRELFKGLAIDTWDEWEWKEYPVIHIDLNAKDYTYKESLAERLSEHLERYEREYSIASPASSLDERFRTVITTAYEKTGCQVVVLIDEYDKPILDTLHDEAMKNMHRDTLRAFYATLKSSDQYLKFCFLTGVTKFGQMNVFSGLNNLNDISLSDRYAGICGITEKELHDYFIAGVTDCAEKWKCTEDEVYCRLKKNYDGYHFSTSLLDVYNPWSLINAICKQFLDTYWNQTGGGLSFLYKLLESGGIDLEDLDNAEVSSSELTGVNVNITSVIPILYQSGYLTIKSYDRDTNLFTLKYPNLEVETGFLKGLLPYYAGVDDSKSLFSINRFVKDVRQGDPDGFLERLQAFFEDFPYENAMKKEKDFQNIMYCIAKLMGLQTKVELHSARGRADMVIESKDFVYVIEFKINKSPEEALTQIEEKGYAKPYAKDPRTLFKVGVEFSLAERNIARWKIV